MARRLREPQNLVTLRIDGRSIVGNAGEPLAATLIANGIDTIARSPKFHRPRGASCMRGGCDGCVVRVNGVPNVLGCLEPCAEGLEVETQNRLGPRDFDLLRVNDWFFPGGMNHHEVFIGVPGAEPFLRVFARRISGLGHLPDDPLPIVTGARRAAPVVVVGAGAAGLAAAVAFADAGHAVELIDENVRIDAALSSHAGLHAERVASLLARVQALAAAGQVVLRPRTKAVGSFSGLLLVEGAAGAEVLDAAFTVFATGAHDGSPLFEGNDLPGVYSLRAAHKLVACGVAPGARLVIVVDEDTSAPVRDAAQSLARAFEAASVPCVLRVGRVVKAHGSSAVSKVTVRVGETDEKHAADALIVETRRAPSFELAAQAGASVARVPGGFAVVDRVWGGRYAVLGEATGASPDVEAFEVAARELAATYARG
jgi:sarcosine oxidase subunit alpha